MPENLSLHHSLRIYTIFFIRVYPSRYNWKVCFKPRLNSPPPPLSCRILPACSIPSTRSSTPPSTILPAAARHYGSSCRWLLTPASGGGVVHRVLQVKLALTQWVRRRRREGILGSPLCCPLSAHPEMCLLSCRKAAASGLSELCSLQSRRRSISPTQWGSFLMMGGVTEPREASSPSPPAPSNTLKETLRDVPSPFDNHSHFSFLQSSLFYPSFPPPFSGLPGKYSYVQLNFSH